MNGLTLWFASDLLMDDPLNFLALPLSQNPLVSEHTLSTRRSLPPRHMCCKGTDRIITRKRRSTRYEAVKNKAQHAPYDLAAIRRFVLVQLNHYGSLPPIISPAMEDIIRISYDTLSHSYRQDDDPQSITLGGRIG